MSQWQTPPQTQVPKWLINAIKPYVPNSSGQYGAQLLWQRGHQDPQKLAGFLNPDVYQPTSPWEFGQEMRSAVTRLVTARQAGEKVTIWGDFDADGITSTSVLWEGLGQFFPQHQQLNYYIPNRLTESHGLNYSGIEQLAATGTTLIVTCDTGSTNLTEIDYAQQLGIDIIISDHHTLPSARPPVVAIINPRYFRDSHPLYHLSGVAVAYKLVEAMYGTLPDIPQQPVSELLDLVAIGLIADLVQLSGDCRYLAQRGIEKLKQTTRPGIKRLLELCQRSGDRPTDISFGIGPRINAVSRIHGDATFCVELLTSRDPQHTQKLAMETELANTRRKELQKNVTAQVTKKLAQIDLSTTSVIVLEDNQWQGGVLGLVAGQIAQEYHRPTILLNVDEVGAENQDKPIMARGSARSIGGIDLYELVNSQAHLLHRFGGHPFAAGLSLLVENVPLFREAINQQLRQQNPSQSWQNSVITTDLQVNVEQLGKKLFRELKLLEPCGMGNPVPKLLIQNCWFTEVWNKNTQDYKGRKVQYIKSTFSLCDESAPQGFPGVWWGHYKEDIPTEQTCDAVVELDYNTYQKRYEVRLIALRNREQTLVIPLTGDLVLDWRDQPSSEEEMVTKPIILGKCPISWLEIETKFSSAIALQKKLALAYHYSPQTTALPIWKQLIGIAKYLSRTQKSATLKQFQDKLSISNYTLQLGLQALESLGFQVQNLNLREIKISFVVPVSKVAEEEIDMFLAAVEEEQFLQQYFYQVPLTTVEIMLDLKFP